MNIKAYKIWRFAYSSHEENLYVPEGVEFYCFNKESSIKNFENFKKDPRFKGLYPNQHWIAVIPYSKEVEEISYRFSGELLGKSPDIMINQALAVRVWNLNNIYLIWDLDQIYPLCEDWPETTVPPIIDTQYIKIRMMDGPSKLHKELASFLEHKVTDEEYNEWFPIGDYLKLDGIGAGVFKGVHVKVKNHPLIESNSIMIVKDTFPFKVLDDFPCSPGKTKVEVSNREEFFGAFNYVVSQV